MKKEEAKPRNRRNLYKYLKMIKRNAEILAKYKEELKK
jgi:hypothetical protein